MSVYILLGVFLLCSSLVYPLLYVIPPITSFAIIQEMFSITTISSLALGLTFLNYIKFRESLYRQYFLTVSIGLFAVIPVIHYFIFPTYRFSDVVLSLFWVTVPLFVFSCRKAAGKFVAPYLLILWGLDIVRSLLTLDRSNAGIVGNQNWHAAFLVVTTPFALYSIAKLFDFILISPGQINSGMALTSKQVCGSIRGLNLASFSVRLSDAGKTY